jgi:hypothetical protein
MNSQHMRRCVGVSGVMTSLLIHEGAQMLWSTVIHGGPGQGGNFRHAECYASLAGDIFNIPPGGPAYPTPPERAQGT